jgi:hypothetical protein
MSYHVATSLHKKAIERIETCELTKLVECTKGKTHCWTKKEDREFFCLEDGREHKCLYSLREPRESKLGMHSFLPFFIFRVLFLPFLFDSCPGCEVRVGPLLEPQESFEENLPTQLLVKFMQ